MRGRTINLCVLLEMLIAFIRLHDSFIRQYTVLCNLFCNTDENVGNVQNVPAINFAAFMENRKLGDRAQSPCSFTFRE